MSAEPLSPKNPGPPEPMRDGEIVRATIQRRIALHTQVPEDPAFVKKYPHIWSWATFQDVSEEKIKERASFSFRVAEGLWTVAISDSSMAASLSCAAPTFEEALKGLNSLLGRADAPWSPWRAKEAKLKERKKNK